MLFIHLGMYFSFFFFLVNKFGKMLYLLCAIEESAHHVLIIYPIFLDRKEVHVVKFSEIRLNRILRLTLSSDSSVSI
jgi:hypothetical protein